MSCLIKYNDTEVWGVDKQGNISKTFKDLLNRGYDIVKASNIFNLIQYPAFKQYSTEPPVDELIAYSQGIPLNEFIKFRDNEYGEWHPKNNINKVRNQLRLKYPNLTSYIYETPANINNQIRFELKLDNQYYYQLEKEKDKNDVKQGQLNQKLNNKLRELLQGIGVSVDYLENNSKFSKLNVVGLADMFNKIAYVSENRSRLDTLAEESSHFFVEFLKQNQNPLYKSLMQDIEKYDEYKEVVQEYSNIEGYEDITKLREEAVAKVLATRIINGFSDANYKEKRVLNWFNQVLDFFKEKLQEIGLLNAKEVEDYFDITATKILEGQFTGEISKKNDTFYQVNNASSKLIAELLKKDSEISEEEALNKNNVLQKIKFITIDGIKKRIKRVSELIPDYYKAPTKEIENANLKKSQFGTIVHNDFQYWAGEILGVANKDSNRNQLLSSGIITGQIQKFLRNILKEFDPKDHTFLSEIALHNGKISGTVDLMIIENSTGKVHILDYKNISNLENQAVSTKKKEDWITQLTEYRKLLKNYGVTKFGQARIIPINILYNDKTEPLYNSFNVASNTIVQDGNVNVVPLLSERTGNVEIDKILDLMNDRLKYYVKTNQVDKLNRLRDSITKTQISKGYQYIGEQALIDNNIINGILNKENPTKEEIIQLNEFLDYYTGRDFERLAVSKLVSEEENNKTKKNDTADLVEVVFQTLKQNRDKIDDLIRKSTLDDGVTETIIKPTKWWDSFYKLSEQDNPIMQAFYRLLSRAFAEKENKVSLLKEKVKGYVNQARKETGKNDETMYHPLLQKDKDGKFNGKLITARSVAWYNYFKDNKTSLYAPKTGESISYLEKGVFAGIIDYTKFSKDYQEGLNKLKKEIEGVDDESFNKQVYTYKRMMLNRLTANSEYFDVSTDTFAKKGFVNPEYKRLGLTEKDPSKRNGLANLYHSIVELNKFAREAGNTDVTYNLLPYVKKSTILTALNSPKKVLNSISDGLQLSEWETFELDSTGKKIYKIPLRYKTDLKNRDLEQQSYDLGELVLTWADAVYSNDLLNKQHSSSLLLYEQLKRSKQYVIGTNGKPIKKEGVLEVQDVDNKTLETFMDYHNSFFYGVNTKDQDFKVFGGLSGQKVVKGVSTYFRTKQLSGNVFSAVGNLTGGFTNLFLFIFKHLNKSKIASTIYKIGSRDIKMGALLDAFDIETETYDRNRFKDVSVSRVNKFFTLDKFFFLQKAGDKAMQSTILGTMAENYTFDGTHIRIKKEGEKSIYEQITVGADGKIKLPFDIEKSDVEIFKFREKARSVISTMIGNTSDFDKSLAGNTLIGQSLLMYRRWMLPLGVARFGNLRYNESLEDMQIGKYRSSFNLLVDTWKENKAKGILELIRGIKTGTFHAVMYKNYLEALEINPKLRRFGQSEEESFEEFQQLYINNLRSTAQELTLILALILLKASFDDDDDSSKIVNRILSRTIAESSFWFVPQNFQKIVSSPIPLVNHLSSVAELALKIPNNLIDDKEALDGTGKLLKKNLIGFSAYESFLSTINKND